MAKLSIVIPVFNEAATIRALLDNVMGVKLPGVVKEIIIVEDNSTDGTREIVKDFAHHRKTIKLLLRNKPQGKGSAVRAGLKLVTGEIVLIQDADLEYDVADYSKLIRPIMEGKAQFVLGSRHLHHHGRPGWLIRKFKGQERIYAHFMNLGGIFFHTFFNLVYGTSLTDPTTMYKVFDSKLLDRVNLQGKYFELDWEIVGKFVRLGYLPLEIPVKYQSRSFAQGKKIKFSRDVLIWLKIILTVRFLPIKKL